ncbi:hypothetical protein SEVIR_4G246401v4 [Setaria viridis]|uniref:Uncharacterized protein n=1 Tax=Setaria viridis TaxID=4556 RepID=A0A4U6V103_SETVI|nr:hypothetical protein SEVIR_4G246401v2 [Setaria viridis]
MSRRHHSLGPSRAPLHSLTRPAARASAAPGVGAAPAHLHRSAHRGRAALAAAVLLAGSGVWPGPRLSALAAITRRGQSARPSAARGAARVCIASALLGTMQQHADLAVHWSQGRWRRSDG